MELFYVSLYKLISFYKWIHHFSLNCMRIEGYECNEDLNPLMYQDISCQDQAVEIKLLYVWKDCEVVRL